MNIKTRILLFFCAMTLLSPAARAVPKFPELTGRVVDNARILDSATVDNLTSRLAAGEKETGTQIVVVTLASLSGQEIEEYGYQLGRAWGIGQKGKNNGVLVIVAPKEHKTRIEVGYGLEGQLTDALCSSIVNSAMIPSFRNGDYAAGIERGVDNILDVLSGTSDGTAETQTETQADNGPVAASSGGIPFQKNIGLMDLFLIVFVFYAIFRRSRQRQGFLLPLVMGSLLSRGGRSSGSSSGSFGGGSSFGSGFSGGGGSFGGGGASGSW